MTPSDDDSWARQLLVGLAALVVVSLIVGGVVAAVGFGAVRVTGLGRTGQTTTVEPSLVVPSGRPTVRLEGLPDPSSGNDQDDDAAAENSGGRSEKPSPSASRSPRPRVRAITLRVVPTEASIGQRVDLSGGYSGAEGVTLQVQRFESGWTDFGVTATVTGGAFSTYVLSGRLGENRFRVVDPATGRTSNPVTVSIR